ncbi:MAG: LptF/LptG family permease [Fibrobacterota bacterium]
MILYRYILRKHALPFLYSLAVIIFLFMMQLVVDMLEKILAKGIPLVIVGEILLLNISWMLALAVPMAVLVSTLMAFGQMSADSEITAVKASGRNLYYMITPVFLAAVLIATMLIFFNNLIYPDANHKAATLMADIGRKKPGALIEPNVLIKDFKNYALIVEDVDNKTGALEGIRIFTDAPDQDPSTTVAESGNINVTADGKYIRLELFNGETHSLSRENKLEYFVGEFEQQVVYIENVDSELRRSDNKYRGDREKSAQMLLADVAEYRKSKESHLQKYQQQIQDLIVEINRLDSLADSVEVQSPDSSELVSAGDSADSSDSAAGALSDSEISPRTFRDWQRKLDKAAIVALRNSRTKMRELERTVRNVEVQDKKIAQYLVEAHKKYSIPISAIVFILIGAPLGIMAKRGGMGTGVTYSIFFFIIFWAFLIGGENMADRLLVSPAVAMWSANVLLTIVGVFLIIRMVKETTFISFQPLIGLWRKGSGRMGKNRVSKVVSKAVKMLLRLPNVIMVKIVGILPAYLIRLFLGYSIGVFAGLIVIFVVVDYIGNLRYFENAFFGQIALYYWYYLHWYILLIAPIGMLLASMFAMGRMTKYSELTAIKASGISVRKLTLPLLFLGLILSGVTFWIGEKTLPEANARRIDLRQEMKHGKMSVEQRKGVFHRNFYYFGNDNQVYCFQEFGTHPQRSKNVFREQFEDHQIVERIQAEQFVYREGKWFFIDGHMRRFDSSGTSMATFDTLYDTTLTAEPKEMVARIKHVDEMSYWELSDAIAKAERRGEKVHTYQADLYFKIALPFMNFIVILLGISITARAGRKGGGVLFGFGLFLTFFYWAISNFSLAMGQNGRMSPLIAAWGGNVLFFLLGIILYRKASR